MADWERALDGLVATWLHNRSERGAAFMEGYAKSLVSRERERARAPEAEAAEMRSFVDRMLWLAEPVYVTPQMTQLVEAAFQTFEVEPIEEDSALIKSGWVEFARPIMFPDARGAMIANRAIGWSPVKFSDGTSGLGLATFAAAGDRDEYWDGLTPKEQQGARDFLGDAYAIGHITFLRFGATPMTPERWQDVERRNDMAEYDPVLASDSDRQLFALFETVWRLMAQRIAVGMRVTPPRHQRKRSAAVDHPSKYITVVTLRRPRASHDAGDDDPKHVEWSMRWIVSGHWRWQPYGDGSHRQIWIAPYVKGPEDRPLVVRGARVFRFAR